MQKLQQSSLFQFCNPMMSADMYNRSPGMATNSNSSAMSSPKSPSSPISNSSDGASESSDVDVNMLRQRRTSDSGSDLSGLPRLNLTDLHHFPSELADPARLLLVSCTDQSKAHLYTCRECATVSEANTVWALNFHHRHAFCTGCGQSAADSIPAKLFAELFMVAACAYLDESQQIHLSPNSRNNSSNKGWWVGADSSCILRFMNATGADACGCSSESCYRNGHNYDEEEEEADCSSNSVWAVNSVYSHAFCTRCGRSAEGGSLLSLLMIIRFGGKKFLSRRCSSNNGGCPKSSGSFRS